MEEQFSIPNDIQRFILRSINSVPHLEAILLLRKDASKEWDAKMMASQLYIREKQAEEILDDLASSGFVAIKMGERTVYRYNPISLELEITVNKLAELYTKNLLEITKLIHFKIGKQAQQFGDAFRFRDEKE